MTTITAIDLPGRLTDVYARLAAGEAFLVTDRDRPVARLLPPETTASAPPPAADAWWRELSAWRRDAADRSGRASPGFAVDDGREAAYAGREDAQR